MATYAVILDNPGAEKGGTTGWTTRVGGGFSVSASSPHSGLYKFVAGASVDSAKWDQQVELEAGLLTTIDGGACTATASAWHMGNAGDTDSGALYVEAYDASLTLLDRAENVQSDPAVWTQESVSLDLPTGTRFLRIGTNNVRHSGVELSSYWDDFELTIDGAFDPSVINMRASQVVSYGLVSRPAEELRGHQLAVLSVNAAEESSGQYLMNAHQVVAYALVKGKAERVDLRAWTFLQDDHLFYGLQLGSGGTIVHDMLTRQWCQWSSPGKNYWRVEDAVDWEGYNLGCDTENGTIWKIDPVGRLDEGTTVITSQVTGQATVRGRRAVPCYTAELACSQAEPAAATGTSIQLRTSDDASQSWTNHGTVDGEATGTRTLFRWYGLGLLQAPGRVFEITNSGYARRIDGLDAELGGAQ